MATVVQRISDEQGAIARSVYSAGRALGVTAIRTRASRRVHAGYDASAWSKPTLIIYGDITDEAPVRELASGWNGDIEFQR